MYRSRALLFAAVATALGGSFAHAASPSFTGITSGALGSSVLDEVSGIASSRKNPNVLWVHNDSGNTNQVFAMTPAGANLGAYTLSGTTNTDWEDMAVGPGPTAGVNYLYIGDIGDNGASRANVRVVRIAEPDVSDTQSPVTTTLSGAATMTFAYPDGAKDAESMFVDPLTRDIFIIAKSEATKNVYRAAYPQATSGTTALTLITSINNTIPINSADISPDGNEIITRAEATNSGRMYLRPLGGSIADALATPPINIPLLTEGNGEAIGFDPQGHGYYSTSEGVAAPVHYYNRLPPPAKAMYWDSAGLVAGNNLTIGAGMGGSGTWDAASLRWYNASCDVAWAGGCDAVFWGPMGGSVTLASTQTVNSLSFKTNGYTLTGAALTLAGPNVTVDAGVTATINSVIAGSSGLVKNGAGTLLLRTSNTFTGATSVLAGKLALAAGSGAILKTNAVSIAGASQLDLADRKLIVTAQSEGSWNGSVYDGVTGLVASGRAGGSWTGNGIVTSMTTAAAGNLTSLGVETQPNGDVLVMYTYGGDANLDGKLDIDDYVRIDQGLAGGLVGWSNGDFNYDGKVNIDDYTTFIDVNLGNQNGFVFATASGGPASAGLSAIPEPASAALLITCALLPARRRRR